MINKQIIIGGFHRSGTSFLARILHDAGIGMGEKMLGARASNIHGHYEDIKIVKLHNQILFDNRLNWMEDQMRIYQFSDKNIQLLRKYVKMRDQKEDLWGFKDPRLCLFPMLWKMLMPNMKMVIVYRHYAGCYMSLSKRHMAQLVRSKGDVEKNRHLNFWHKNDLILKMWLVYNKHLLNFVKLYPNDSIVMNYENILNRSDITSLIENKWDVDLKKIDIENYIDSNLVNKLNHDRVPCSSKNLADEVNNTFNKLEQLKELSFS